VSEAPLVSVAMATYNCAPTLPDALASIENQTYTNWELVACDDASTDNSHALLEEFAARHPGKVTVLRNEINSKLSFSLNRCLAVANGELIARMDGDDKCLPERFEKQVAFLTEHPELAVVGTAMRRFDETGEHDVLEYEARPDRWSLRHKSPFAHATIVMRKPAYQVLNGYVDVPRTIRCEDRDLWFRFTAEGFAGANLPEPLYLVREDLDAIRRRTFQNRWNNFRTELIGFRLLKYPVGWFLNPFVQLGKALVPAKAMLEYRKWQGRKVTVVG